MNLTTAGVEFHVAVLAKWESSEGDITFSLHHDAGALSSANNTVFKRLESAQYVLLDATEWATIPVEYGSVQVSLDNDHYTAIIGGTPTIFSGHIVDYGAHI